MKLLTTRSTSRTGYYMCLFMQTQFQPGSYSYIDACTNETHSIANLQDLASTLALVCVAYNYCGNTLLLPFAGGRSFKSTYVLIGLDFSTSFFGMAASQAPTVIRLWF